MMGVDVRSEGSGNIGATNVARTVGARLGLLTLGLDIAKGALPPLIASALGAAPAGIALVGLATVLGHVYSIFSAFRGGKGVATAAGMFLVLAPGALGVALIAFAFAAAVSRRASVASLSAVASLPIALAAGGDTGPRFWVAVIVAALIFAAHRDNLRRLLAGTEPPFSLRRSRPG